MKTQAIPQENVVLYKQQIIPNLWFDGQAEEAVQLYTSLFANARIGHVTLFDEASAKASGQPEGSVLTVSFELEGQQFLALNGGPHFKFTPAISFFVICETQEEASTLWSKLGEGGTVMMELGSYDWSECYGWLQDPYGLSWQIMLGSKDDVGQKIIPSLLFVDTQHGKAEEAIHFYTTVFKDSGISRILHYEEGEPNPTGTVKHAQFTLNGVIFTAMESAHEHNFGFNEALSFIVNCTTQTEIDYYWEKLSAHPAAEQCGWLKDPYGVSWQIVPEQLDNLLSDPDSEKVERVMQAMLQMKKIDIAQLEEAYEG